MSDRLSPEEAARRVLWELLGIRADETVAIVADDASPPEMVTALRAELALRGVEACLLVQPLRAPGEENRLSPMVARGLEAAEVMVAITGSGGAPIYAGEVKALLAARRLRFMSMVMRDLDILTAGGATADYRALRAEGERLAGIWRAGGRMRITCAQGTDISAPVAREVFVECGYATEAGENAAFSDGEVSSRPEEGTAEGVFVIDGPGAAIGLPERPIRVTVAAGRVRAVEGEGRAADRLRAILDTVPEADNIAEFGIGLNPACRVEGKFEEEKKRRGAVHIALGDNLFYGGTVRSGVHLDMVLRRPSVALDARPLVEAGRILL